MSLACTVTAIIFLIAPAMDLVWVSANGRSPGFLSEEIIWHQLSRTTDEDRNGLASNLKPSLANYQKKTDDSKDRCRDGCGDDRSCWCSAQFLSSLQILCVSALRDERFLRIQKHLDIPQLCWWTCLDIINSFRETAFKRSLDQAMKHDTAFLHRKRGTDASRWMFKMMRVWKLCTIFLETTPRHLQPFNFCSVSCISSCGFRISSCGFHSCIRSLLQLWVH